MTDLDQVIVPGLVLAAILGAVFWVLVRAQRLDHFDASQFLRDERGQLAWKLLIGAICFAVHSWAMMVITMGEVWIVSESLYLWMWGIYVGVWSGSVVVLQALESWRAVRLGVTPAMPPADLGGFAAPSIIIPGSAQPAAPKASPQVSGAQ